MKYIIDANNLAGKLKMLGDKNFDKKLIEMIKDYTKGKKNEIIIVFDPQDEWGDKKVISDTITAVYSPRDEYYESADDKIVEMIENAGTDRDLNNKDELTIISDDVGLIKRIKKIKEKTNQNINFIRATEYASKLINSIKDNEEDKKEELSQEEVDSINNELRKIWQ